MPSSRSIIPCMFSSLFVGFTHPSAVTSCSLFSLILMTDTQILKAVHKMVSSGYVADIQADVETLIETQWAIQKEQDRVTRRGIAAQRRAAKRALEALHGVQSQSQ